MKPKGRRIEEEKIREEGLYINDGFTLNELSRFVT
jgi:hypothetical protein